ncbi:MAG: glycosyltransferase family 4 protein [Actinomycetota bacterium]|nr:glycosyltransferase family 4 protein [Actinomycetota bacterium]
MKIGLIAPIWYPIPPVGYGGIELVVSLLAEGLVDKGHDVTVFASGDSKTRARLVSSCDVAPCALIGQVYPDLVHALTAYTRAAEFDVIHDHSGIIGPSVGAFSATPVLHTLHGPATAEAKKLYNMLNFGLSFNAISNYQRSQFGDLSFVDTIYNAVDMGQYPFSVEKEDYLLFLGRMNPEKGAHIAVDVANRLGRRLVLVTKMVEPAEIEYFETRVKPLLDSNVEIMGEIDPVTKAGIFSKAACTLFPIQWPEPFGLVMIESMATGTPVVAMRQGAVPEVIADERTGYIVDTVDEMVEAVAKAQTLDPRECRTYVEGRFSQDRMVDDYVAAYKQILEARSNKAA